MKNVMKTIMRNTKLVMILAFLPALLSAAQAQYVQRSQIRATVPTRGVQSSLDGFCSDDGFPIYQRFP